MNIPNPNNTLVAGKGDPEPIFTVPVEGKDKWCGKSPAVILCDPLYAKNAASIMRTCAAYGIEQMWWTGNRVTLDLKERGRFPREERMRGYKAVRLFNHEKPLTFFEPDVVPVAMEVCKGSINLLHFDHLISEEKSDKIVYVFGPEDGSIYHPLMRCCHYRIQIPTRHCLNLGQAVSTLLWDRYQKRYLAGLEPELTPGDMLALGEQRGHQ